MLGLGGLFLGFFRSRPGVSCSGTRGCSIRGLFRGRESSPESVSEDEEEGEEG